MLRELDRLPEGACHDEDELELLLLDIELEDDENNTQFSTNESTATARSHATEQPRYGATQMSPWVENAVDNKWSNETLSSHTANE